MWQQFLSENEVAGYLHCDPAEVRQRAKYGEIPFATRGKRIVFPKQEIDFWASQRIFKLTGQKLAAYHLQTTRDTLSLLPQKVILPQLIEPGFIAPALTAKTKASVLRELVSLAEATGRLNNPEDLLASLEKRERLGSTAMPAGFALPHPHGHSPYSISSSFIVVGRMIQPINFGAPDGLPTHLFFMICCHDDRLHLHALARLCCMVKNTGLLDEISCAGDSAGMLQCILAAEKQVTVD